MILEDHLEFHAEELRQTVLGKQLLRLPQSVGDRLNPRARFVARDSIGTEIRFVCEAPRIRISLAALRPEFLWEKLEVTVFCGDFELRPFELEEGRVVSLVLDRPPVLRELSGEALRSPDGSGFAPQVWRIVSGTGGLIFSGLETFGFPVRPPRPEEKPRRTCLFYGSSLTNAHAHGFAAVAARRLGVQMINLGFSGSCACEMELAEWIGSSQWEIGVLAPGTNLAGWIPAGEFQSRLNAFLERIVPSHPGTPVFLLTIPPSFRENRYRAEPSADGEETDRFNDIIRRCCRNYAQDGNVHLIEGESLIDDFRCLKADGQHPGFFGHAVMGLNLARQMKPVLDSWEK